MRWWSLLVSALVVIAPFARGSPDAAAAEAEATTVRPIPPVAARKPVRLTTHGIERVDDYAWLRDPNWREVIQNPSRLAPDIRAHLDAENSYAEAVLAPLSGLRVKLVEEMKGRIEQDESGVPSPDGPYAYWSKYAPRRRAPTDRARARPAAGPSKCCSTGPRWRPESPTSRSATIFTARTTAATPTRSTRPAPRATRCASAISARDATCRRSSTGLRASPGRRTAARCSMCGHDENHRPRFVYRHRVGTDPAKDRLVYEEKDLGFEVSVNTTRSGRFVVISTSNGDTSEERLIDAARPLSDPVLVVRRQPGLRYSVRRLGRPVGHPHQCRRRRRLQDRHRARVGAGPRELARSGALQGRPAHPRRGRLGRPSRQI